jgi:membrane fusion protein (multidrug efflux system)
MNISVPNSLRKKSPLCTDIYRTPLADLPRARPPRWMRNSMISGVALTIAVTAFTLLNPMDEFVTAPGVVRPADYTYVFSRASGLIESIEILDGQRVTKGQVLARLDGWDVRKQMTQIEGEIAQAEAELAMVQATARKVAAAPVPAEFLFSAVEMERQKEIQSLQQDYLKRLNELQKSGAASATETLNLRLQLIASESLLKRSQQAYDLFKGDYGAASQAEARERERMIQARLSTLRAKRELAAEDLKRLEIVAPEDGVILATAPRFPGEKIEAGATLFKIADADRTELRLYATEDRVNLIQPGQLVRFRANNNPDRLAPLGVGRVSHVARDRDLSTSEDAGSRGTYRVSVTIEKEPYPLAVGATVEAEIVLERRPFWRLLFLKPQPNDMM